MTTFDQFFCETEKRPETPAPRSDAQFEVSAVQEWPENLKSFWNDTLGALPRRTFEGEE